jgi:hypothetical protein
MRVETTKIIRAFMEQKPAKAKRTETCGHSIYLHGNRIAWRGKEGDIYMTLAGWDTVTTRDRLNGLCTALKRADAKGFRRKLHTPFFGDVPITARTVIRLKPEIAL